MEECPFFSIITPVYNCQKYLCECIESVFKQTFLSWELILVDDGSTDESGKICDDFCFDSRVKVIHQENAGSLASRTKAIDIAKGSYILGLDSDDYLEPNCLETVKDAIDISHSDLIFWGFRSVGKRHNITKSSLESGKIYSRKELIDNVIETTNHALWNKAIKTEKAKRGNRFIPNHKLGVCNDYLHVISILCEIDTGYIIPDILYNYRIHESSTHGHPVSDIFDETYVASYAIYRLNRATILDADMRERLYLAYLKAICGKLSNVFYTKEISLEGCRKIHNSKVYIDSIRVETRKNFTGYKYWNLKLFRYKQYWILRMLAQIKR